MKKIILALVFAISFTVFPLMDGAASDKDEPADWAKKAVAYLNSYQLIPNEFFSMYDAPIQRDEFAALLIGIYNEACQNEYDFPNDDNPFVDTVSNRYAAEIKKAHIIGVINGTSTTTFSPNNRITREDVATLIHRFVKLLYPREGTVRSNPIADRGKISDYAVSSVEFCMDNGIMNGTGGAIFSPKGLLTRQEAMVLMHNICIRYKVVENGRGSAITELTPVYRGLHEMVYDGYLYMREYSYPFSFNGDTIHNEGHSLIRVPLDQSKQNAGELLFTHLDDISVYTVTQDKIFFGDRSLNRGVYSADKDGKNRKLLYNLSGLFGSDSAGDYSFIHVEGDWLFINSDTLFKMRTDGTCLSIIHREAYSDTFWAEGAYFYIQWIPHPAANGGASEIAFSRVSLTGDRTELIYRQEMKENRWSSMIYGDKLYVAISEGNDLSTPLLAVDLETKKVSDLGILYGSLDKDAQGAYLFRWSSNVLYWKNISGGKDVRITIPQAANRGFPTKFGNYLFFSEIRGSDHTRYYYLYNIETRKFTDLFGNPAR
jgi:hypothetical protein